MVFISAPPVIKRITRKIRLICIKLLRRFCQDNTCCTKDLTEAYILVSSIFMRGEKLPDEWLTIDDVYEYLQRKVPKDTIRSWIRSKRLRAYKPARSILIKREDLE